MTPARKIELECHMAILEAEEELKSGDVPDDRIYDLVLLVTGSEEQASQAYSQRLLARLQNGETPQV